MATAEDVTGAVPFEGIRPASPGFAGVYSAATWAGHFKRSMGFDANDPNRGPFYGVWDMFDISAVVGQRKIQIEPGAGIIVGRLFYLENAVQLDVAGGARKDRCIARIYRSSAVNNVEIAILEEVGGSGVYTPLTQSSDPAGIWEIPLWRWESPSGTGDLTAVTFIDDRYYANLPQQIAPEFTNSSGSDFTVGTVLVINSGADQSVNISSAVADVTETIGVAVDPTVAGGVGKVATHGIAQVRVTGAVARGDWLQPSSTSGVAESNGVYGGFAIALEANASGTATIWAQITPRNVVCGCHATYSGAGVAIPMTTWTAIALSTLEYEDTHGMHDNAVNPSRITVPYDGVYQINADVEAVATDDCKIQIWKNGAAGISRAMTNENQFCHAAAVAELVAGDYVEVRAYSADAIFIDTAQMTVCRVG